MSVSNTRIKYFKKYLEYASLSCFQYNDNCIVSSTLMPRYNSAKISLDCYRSNTFSLLPVSMRKDGRKHNLSLSSLLRSEETDLIGDFVKNSWVDPRSSHRENILTESSYSALLPQYAQHWVDKLAYARTPDSFTNLFLQPGLYQ